MSTRLFFLSLAVSGLVLGQPPARGPRMGNRETPEQSDARFEQRLAQHLSLSAEQQNTFHTTRADARVQTKGLHDRMGALNRSLNEAIKAGDEGQIDRISQEIATLHQQQTAIHAKTTAKLYATLTPEQKTKVGKNLEMLNGGGPGFGARFGGPGGQGPRGRRGPGQVQQ